MAKYFGTTFRSSAVRLESLHSRFLDQSVASFVSGFLLHRLDMQVLKATSDNKATKRTSSKLKLQMH
ncbi:hypothetical protein EYF80_010627 [Liparis tanakae]|uniref:Uncharacterized protein n=1 Tax=Liparis tanakae TaxID=230148 RepID=A0A4Z2IMD4_9TELE|nr:hypothetical protein EYF80_010627 [Liparis tanakae]